MTENLENLETPAAAAALSPDQPEDAQQREAMPKTADGRDILRLLDEAARQRSLEASRMQCRVCWHVYDPAEGCPEWNVPPGTPFAELPEDFTCPDCGQPKSSFLPMLDED